MRDVLGRAPTLNPEIDGIPFNGGLVGTTGYDVVRFFERLPDNRAGSCEGLPQAVYVAPESLLVFDHLTRRVALLHAGTESDRQALRARVVKALRGGLDAPDKPGAFSQAAASMTEREFIAAVPPRRRTSRPATSTRSCSRSASAGGRISIRSKPIAACGS